jgi:starvation-inducible DNA-binding protein
VQDHHTGASSRQQPAWLHQQGREIHAFGTVRLFPIALSNEARLYSCERLNQILSDTQILYALYKKHHWLMRGATFYQLHLLLDKHAGEQIKLVDQVAERVQTLGGIAVGEGMSLRSPGFPGRRMAAKRCRRCCRAC